MSAPPFAEKFEKLPYGKLVEAITYLRDVLFSTTLAQDDRIRVTAAHQLITEASEAWPRTPADHRALADAIEDRPRTPTIPFDDEGE